MRDRRSGFLKSALIGIVALGFVSCAPSTDKEVAAEPKEIHAGNAEVGVIIGAHSFCSVKHGASETFMKKFVGAVVEHGLSAYVHIMSLPGVPCRDHRIHDTGEIRLQLKEKKWAFTSKEGESFVVWLAVDGQDKEAYIWLPVKRDLTNGK